MKRLPTIMSFLLFLALVATLTYWILQWTAPRPRAVSAPSKDERTPAPVGAAASLFGGRSQESSLTHVQLRGVVHSGSPADSVAIIAVEGKPTRALKVQGEIVPGMKIKQILDKTVVVSEQGVERELGLPAFAAQESQIPAPPPISAPTSTLPGQTSSASPAVGTTTGASGSSGTPVGGAQVGGAQSGGMSSGGVQSGAMPGGAVGPPQQRGSAPNSEPPPATGAARH